MRERLHQRSLDVGEDSEILLGPAPQFRVLPAQLQRAVELFTRRLYRATLEIEPGKCVQGFSRQNRVADLCGRPVTPVAELTGPGSLVAMMADHAQTTERLRQYSLLLVALRGLDSRGVALERFGHTAGALVRAGVTQKTLGTVGPGILGPPCRRERGLFLCHRTQYATAYREKWSIGAVTVFFLNKSSEWSTSRIFSFSSVYTMCLATSTSKQFW
jgi:hypothetical protein